MDFTTGVDAAEAWPNGKVYLFKDDQYIRYDIACDCADPGYLKLIGGPGTGQP